MLTRTIFFVLFFYGLMIACSPSKVAQETFVADTTSQPLVVVQDISIGDTTYVEMTLEGNPPTFQIDSTIAYVYNPAGVDIYEVTPDFKIDKIVGHLPHKARVELYTELKKDEASNSITFDGLRGYYALVQYNNKAGYVFTGYLSKFPKPETILRTIFKLNCIL